MNLWQSHSWAEFQQALGHQAFWIDDILVLQKSLPFQKSYFEIQRASPSLLTWHKIVERAQKENNVLFCRIAPSDESPLLENRVPLILSKEEFFPSATRIIDVQASETELAASFSQTGRRHLRVAQKSDLHCFFSSDTNRYARLAAITAKRDGFGCHHAEYYSKLLAALGENAFLLVVAKEDRWLAAGIFVVCGSICTYYYGASDNSGRDWQPATLLQWEAMRIAQGRNCQTFDLFGIAPPDKDNHRLEGVSRFKQKFGGEVKQYAPESIVVFRKMWYRFYRTLKWLRSFMR